MGNHRTMPILPVGAYTSQDWFAREQERIFSRTWAFAGLVEDVNDPGQYISVQAGLNNIFIVMGQDRQLRAFHNICRHRGTQLLRAVGKRGKSSPAPITIGLTVWKAVCFPCPTGKTSFQIWICRVSG